MKILVTGGSGFIGTRLIDELLKEKHDVIIYDRVESSKYPELTINGDVRDEKKLIEVLNGVDVIYNLAAEHADDVRPKSLYADVNIGGAINVVNAAKANGVKKIIFTSSVAIYGLNRGEPNEAMDPKPFNEYGRTKYEAEEIFKVWANESNKNSLTIIRPAVIFGEGNRGNVYNLIKQIQSRKFVMIGRGMNKKSMGYVGNIAAFLAHYISFESGTKIYNFAGKPDLCSREIVQIINNELGNQDKIITIPFWLGLLGGYILDFIAFIFGKKLPISSIRIKKFASETTVNTEFLYSTKFKSPYTLEDGIRLMIQSDFK